MSDSAKVAPTIDRTAKAISSKSSDTPKTDDEVFSGVLQTDKGAYVGEYVAASLARLLERELAEAERDASMARRRAGLPPKGGMGPY